jgi:hypothetical protein
MHLDEKEGGEEGMLDFWEFLYVFSNMLPKFSMCLQLVPNNTSLYITSFALSFTP